MATFVALLRGINVGGAGKIRIDELKKLFESLGLEDVRTYIQSGNLVFRSSAGSEPALRKRLERGIAGRFGAEITVVLRTADEMERILGANPFLGTDAREKDSLHVTMLADLPGENALAALEMPPGGRDEFKIVGREIFLYCPDGYGRTRLNNNAFERKLGVRATTRNWATVSRLLEMARSL